MTSLSCLLLGLLAADPSFAPSGATVSAGVLGAWSPAGIGADVRWKLADAALSLGLSGPLPTASLGLWRASGHWRPGLQVHAGIAPWRTSCSFPTGMGESEPLPGCHDRTLGANLMLEADPGDDGGFVIRGGLGPNLYFSCSTIGLLGTLGLGWRW